jgi:hypothetical protein
MTSETNRAFLLSDTRLFFNSVRDIKSQDETLRTAAITHLLGVALAGVPPFMARAQALLSDMGVSVGDDRHRSPAGTALGVAASVPADAFPVVMWNGVVMCSGTPANSQDWGVPPTPPRAA